MINKEIHLAVKYTCITREEIHAQSTFKPCDKAYKDAQLRGIRRQQYWLVSLFYLAQINMIAGYT
jgi:hypothetical protein